ncbi:unnamed protein product [Symbiodinium microadriaticum]|nr:unnamed protein product [Symbiodinium microadriaticum]
MNLFKKQLSTRVLSRTFSSFKDHDVVVAGFARTPIGKLGGALASINAPTLGAHVITAAVERSGIQKTDIEEAFMGNVVSAGIGQAPTRQAVINAGLPLDCPSTTINKVCASGMKATMLAALSIASGYRNCVVAGGMESMSNIPYYLPNARTGYRLGNNTVVDGLIHDGLWDVYNDQHMGICGEVCSDTYRISRDDQDTYALRSYERATRAWEAGLFDAEIAPLSVSQRRGGVMTHIAKDEEFTNIRMDKLRTLKPAFKKDGTVTAANASTLNDGAAAMIVMSGKMARDRGVTPLFRICGFGDAAKDPVEFTTAPAEAVPRALKHANMELKDVHFHEINEAFSVVALANAR